MRHRLHPSAFVLFGALIACAGLPFSAVPQLQAAQLVSVQDLDRIAQAIPSRPLVKPLKPRRLLIFNLNVNYGGHPSMRHAQEAFRLMGEKTGAFAIEASSDPGVFESSNLHRFDAVFFNNNVGNCFTNDSLRQNLLDFVHGGGGLLGVHGATVAFTRWPGGIEDWPEFGLVIGARGANHRDATEHLWIHPDDPSHPLNALFAGQSFEYRDEFFRPQDPYSRDRLRVLLSIDTTRCDPNQGQPRGNCVRPDNDYALAWALGYGRGRVFYSTIAHNPYVFWDTRLLQFYLGAIQFALGDLKAPITPSARLTPEVKALEKLGWTLALAPRPGQSLAQQMATARQLRLSHLVISTRQPAGEQAGTSFDHLLPLDQWRQLRFQLARSSVRLMASAIEKPVQSSDDWRKAFEFARRTGVELLVAEPDPAHLPELEQLGVQFGISLAIPVGPLATRPEYERLDQFSTLFPQSNSRLGFCADLGWLTTLAKPSSGSVDPVLGRLLVVNVGGLAPRPGQPQALNSQAIELCLEQLSTRTAPLLFSIQGDPPETAINMLGQIALKLKPLPPR